MSAQSTTNYSIFKFDHRNREIDESHVEHLRAMIAEHNLLEAYPILVDTDMTVLDGQHRLRAAEALGVPIYYTVSDTATLDDVPSINVSTKHWTNEDYFRRWVVEGRPEYLKLQRFMEDHPFISLTFAMQMCYYGDRTKLYNKFRLGKYIVNDEPWARKTCRYILDFKQYMDHWNHGWFITAMMMLSANADYDHKQMMEKMSYLSPRLVKCPDSQTYIDVINEIYNYKVSKKSKVTLRKLGPSEPKFRTDRKK